MNDVQPISGIVQTPVNPLRGCGLNFNTSTTPSLQRLRLHSPTFCSDDSDEYGADLPSLAPFTVLLVDDRRLSQSMTQTMLALTGLRVVVAQGCSEALETLVNRPVDLVVLDLPDNNCLQLVSEIRERCPTRPPFIFIMSEDHMDPEPDVDVVMVKPVLQWQLHATASHLLTKW
eukprot:NODE_3290_length_791_cov_86.458221_g2747_i0.p1 GENE.NODE_3290_length_791_cov_86.458221_g2747_i0~~NODE_3290_length_791_cov_86.458221_g2747_i0.p1  ORF type:complete len:174 (+),score=19.54 NODE_3290_length_791_cov_86.458221_g2747_i0:74-595(+)